MKKFLYRVKAGDTVLSLSGKYRVPTCDLIRENGLSAEIREGDVLILSPLENAYKVRPSESDAEVAEKLGVDKEKALSSNGFPYFFYGLTVRP